ncbi:MAG: choice-of-anchor Q domain-containing protein [Rudaea sp.]|nr:choice-of-anchor Q domain-containing protein [Rudaea sp.]
MSTANSLCARRVSSGSLKATAAPLAAAIALCLGAAAHATTITVNDATAGSVTGACTIVDAVTALNMQTMVNDCAAGNGINDTIDLTGFTTPTTISFLTSTSGQGHALVLSSAATISGLVDATGTPLVTIERSSVSGTPDFGLISTTQALTINGLALENGYAQSGYLGGAILAGSALIVNYSVISGNASSSAGGGIAGSNSVTINRSTVSGNTAANAGGGILSNSSVRTYYSSISDNSTTSAAGAGGGGIYCTGIVVAGHSTIGGNNSASKGGGINATATVNLTNSTISGNEALAGPGGGVYAMGGGVGLTASTLDSNTATANGGGVFTDSATLTNSTVTGNTAGGAGGGIYATSLDSNYSTIFANTAQTGIGGGVDFSTSAAANATIFFSNMPEDVNTSGQNTLSGNYDLVGSTPLVMPSGTLNCNPMLGSLSNNGGPTKTLPLASGSCAIDAASATPTETTDQRGYVRPAPIGTMPKADIGAYEAGSDPDVIFANGFE